ncbi:MAG: DNA recombination protein RmuC [Clostridia bacterium]|nr:DNA recombination protein RmuC [Clostridia bacterium]
MEIAILAALLLLIVLVLVLLLKNSKKEDYKTEINAIRKETVGEVNSSMQTFSTLMTNTNLQNASAQTELLKQMDKRISDFVLENEQKLENIRRTMESRLTVLQEENNKRLDKMNETVNEKLQKTLEDRIGQSFKMVSERLEQVYKTLGEMQSLATGVGDLKKVLSNVKTRGILGEIQLGSILEQIMPPEQYATNVATKKGEKNVVEYAVILPGDGDHTVYLPIDAKFPADAYSNLMDAYDSADSTRINEAAVMLERRIKSFAKDISDKYIAPPETTDFAIMFLPTEGLYAEVLRRNLSEVLQRDYKVIVAGPTNMAAILNSLQMGFRTLAIQKRSGEVWDVLGAVKTEFDKFATVLESAQKRIEMANNDLDKLVGTRTRVIQRKLKSVTALPESETVELLGKDVFTDSEEVE